mmetsp:Transcript_10072/g.22637  ORF Transcript_10072/g.22637 Transcript_10072/m.22637 type:complete len:169 (-) Transcript_10072:149-655(-)
MQAGLSGGTHHGSIAAAAGTEHPPVHGSAHGAPRPPRASNPQRRRRERSSDDEFMADVPIAPPEEEPDIPGLRDESAWPSSEAVHDSTESQRMLWTPDACSNAECPICLAEFQALTEPAGSTLALEAEGGHAEDKFVVVLRCRHGFHTQCIRQWLSRRFHCPVCRGDC